MSSGTGCTGCPQQPNSRQGVNRYLPMVEAALTDAGCEVSAIEIEVQPELEQPEPIVEEPQIQPKFNLRS